MKDDCSIGATNNFVESLWNRADHNREPATRSFRAFAAAVLTNLAPVRFFAVGAWELTDAIAKGFALRAGNKR